MRDRSSRAGVSSLSPRNSAVSVAAAAGAVATLFAAALLAAPTASTAPVPATPPTAPASPTAPGAPSAPTTPTAPTALTAPAAPKTATRPPIPAADAVLAEILERDGGSGVTAAVLLDGRLVWSGSAGMADLEAGLELGPRHKLRIGSVSKPLTAVLALRLVEAGVLDLDAPIQDHVPGFARHNEPVTLRRLLSHTAGVRHYDFSDYLEANNVRYYPELAAALPVFADDPLVAVPGTAFHYSSLGFNLAGMAIESATGGSFGEALGDRVTGPLGLLSTLPNDPLAIVPDRGGFYTVTMQNPMMPWMRDGELINTIFRDDSDLYPSGGLLSTAEDLAVFADAVFRTDFLSAESRRLLTTPARLTGGEPVVWSERGEKGAYSLGWGIFPTGDGGVFYGHGGETNGAFALVRYLPADRLAIGAIANYNTVTGETAFFELAGEEIPRRVLEALARRDGDGDGDGEADADADG